jgi:hypothetical protein
MGVHLISVTLEKLLRSHLRLTQTLSPTPQRLPLLMIFLRVLPKRVLPLLTPLCLQRRHLPRKLLQGKSHKGLVFPCKIGLSTSIALLSGPREVLRHLLLLRLLPLVPFSALPQ